MSQSSIATWGSATNFSNLPCANRACSRYQGVSPFVKTLLPRCTPHPGGSIGHPRGGTRVYHRAVAVDGFDRLYETARALGEDTRFRIYRQLYRSSDPVAVTTLAQEFSLHPNAIRQHLSRLEQAGLVVSRAERGGGGAGRPRRLYE